VENLKDIQKLIDQLRKLLPRSSEEDLVVTAQSLYELGKFLVQLRIKNHSNPPKTLPMEGFGEKTRNPP